MAISSSQVFVAVGILIIMAGGGGVANATGGDVCGATKPGPERDLCTKLIKGAHKWDQAMINVVKSIMAETKKSKPLVYGLPSHLPATLKPISKDSMVETCKESYDNVMDNLKKVLQNVKNGDPMGSIPVELSATLDAYGDCTDGLSEFGVDDPQIDKARDTIQKYSSISLAVSSMKKKIH